MDKELRKKVKEIIKYSMAFKLKSGNSPMFDKLGGEKETTEQYNARVRAEYEAKLQAHSDSTNAYNKAVIIDDLYNKGQNIKNQSTQELFNTFPQEKLNREAWKRNAREAEDLRVQNVEIRDEDTEEKIINPDLIQDREGFFRDKYGRYSQETEETQQLLRENYNLQEKKSDEFNENLDKYNFEAKTARKDWVRGMKRGGRTIKEGKVLEKELKEGEIYPTVDRRLKRSGDNEFTYNTTADQVKPGRAPIEPMEMIDRMGIKNINMEEPTIPDIIEPSKRKYIRTGGGKWKINLETGEKTRVKTQKVKKYKKPRGRKVRNIVTGGINIVQ